MSLLEQPLQSAIALHGTGLVLTILEGLTQSHAVQVEHTKHGLFLKLLFPMTVAHLSNHRNQQVNFPPPGLVLGIEPEVEVSPMKTSDGTDVSPLSKGTHDDLCAVKESIDSQLVSPVLTKSCPIFDIYSESAEPEDPVYQAEQIIQQIVKEAERMQIRKDADEYSTLIDQHFNNLFENLPKRPFTQLTRRQFEKKYSDINRKPFWRGMCCKHFNETGDPLAKTDALLEVANVIHQHLSA